MPGISHYTWYYVPGRHLVRAIVPGTAVGLWCELLPYTNRCVWYAHIHPYVVYARLLQGKTNLKTPPLSLIDGKLGTSCSSVVAASGDFASAPHHIVYSCRGRPVLIYRRRRGGCIIGKQHPYSFKKHVFMEAHVPLGVGCASPRVPQTNGQVLGCTILMNVRLSTHRCASSTI